MSILDKLTRRESALRDVYQFIEGKKELDKLGLKISDFSTLFKLEKEIGRDALRRLATVLRNVGEKDAERVARIVCSIGADVNEVERLRNASDLMQRHGISAEDVERVAQIWKKLKELRIEGKIADLLEAIKGKNVEELVKVASKREEIEREIVELTARKRELEESLGKLSKEIERLREEYSKVRGELFLMQKERTKEEERLKELRTILSIPEISNVESLIGRLEEMQRERDVLAEELRKLREEKEEIEGKIQAISLISSLASKKSSDEEFKNAFKSLVGKEPEDVSEARRKISEIFEEIYGETVVPREEYDEVVNELNKVSERLRRSVPREEYERLKRERDELWKKLEECVPKWKYDALEMELEVLRNALRRGAT